jgi:hypothetical protein
MDEALTTPRRRFTGRPGARRPADADFDYLADVLLSRPAPDAPGAGAATAPPDPGPSFVVVDAGGVDPHVRRRNALAAAGRLAPQARTAAVFVFHDSRADAHIVGEPACGRLGPPSFPGAATLEETVDGLVRGCDLTCAVLLDGPPGGLAPVRRKVRRIVFLATPDAESLIETYRRLKQWRAASCAQAGLLVVADPAAGQAERVHRRLWRAAHEFLGADLAMLGCLAADAPAGDWPPRPWRSIFAEVPAADVWPRLGAPHDDNPPGPAADAPPAPPLPAARDPAAAGPAACALLQVWRPAGDGALLEAVEAQVPALLGPRFRAAIRVDVQEPGAPPLAGVRDDGALVAIIIQESAATVETRAAEEWLRVHRSLLVRAYPSAGISADAAPAAMVLAPLEVPTVTDGRRRFLPVQCGGRKGVVLLP